MSLNKMKSLGDKIAEKQSATLKRVKKEEVVVSSKSNKSKKEKKYEKKK